MTKINIQEPTTMITDYILFLLGIVLSVPLIIRGIEKNIPADIFWAIGLIAIAISALLGGTAHGFRKMLSEKKHHLIWVLTLIVIGIASAAIVIGITDLRIKNQTTQRIIIIVTLLLLIIYIFQVVRKPLFIIAILGYAPAMIYVLVIEVITLITTNTQNARISASWNIAAVIISFIGAGIQASKKIVIHKHFNHNDLYHVIQMIGIMFFYLAGINF